MYYNTSFTCIEKVFEHLFLTGRVIFDIAEWKHVNCIQTVIVSLSSNKYLFKKKFFNARRNFCTVVL